MGEFIKLLKIWNTPNPAKYRVFIKCLEDAIETQNQVDETPVDKSNNSDVCDNCYGRGFTVDKKEKNK